MLADHEMRSSLLSCLALACACSHSTQVSPMPARSVPPDELAFGASGAQSVSTVGILSVAESSRADVDVISVPLLPPNANPVVTSTRAVRTGRRLIRDGWLLIEVDGDEDRARVLARARSLAEERGGFIAAETQTSVSLRLPSEQLDPTMEALARGEDVLDRGSRVQEVTAQYVDLATRIHSQRRLKTRLQELLGRAGEVKDVLEIEKELARVTEELERLEGRMRVLDEQIDFAAIELTMQERASPGPLGWVFYGLFKGIKWLFVWD